MNEQSSTVGGTLNQANLGGPGARNQGNKAGPVRGSGLASVWARARGEKDPEVRKEKRERPWGILPKEPRFLNKDDLRERADRGEKRGQRARFTNQVAVDVNRKAAERAKLSYLRVWRSHTLSAYPPEQSPRGKR